MGERMSDVVVCESQSESELNGCKDGAAKKRPSLVY